MLLGVTEYLLKQNFQVLGGWQRPDKRDALLKKFKILPAMKMAGSGVDLTDVL